MMPFHKHPEQIDVAILGAGPAGCAAAIRLAGQGRRVLLVERTHYDEARIGETLPPRVRPLLAALGMSGKLDEDGHLQAPGILAAWGAESPRCNDFIVNPHGNGWHLDRARFDRSLAECARSAGVTFREGTAVTSMDEEGEGWRMGLHGPMGNETVACRFVVDATGRRASPIKRRAGRRTVHDRLIGVAAFTRSRDADRRTLIEAAPDGWWYSTPLPDARQVTVYMTDADGIDCGRGALGAFMQRQLRSAPLTRERCGDLENTAHVEAFPATTCEQETVSGENWLLAGDAATAWDPLSGQGVCKALESGVEAARAAGRALDGDRSGLAAYGTWTRERFGEYMAARQTYYRAEQRWPHSPFWRRRHAQPGDRHVTRSNAARDRSSALGVNVSQGHAFNEQ